MSRRRAMLHLLVACTVLPGLALTAEPECTHRCQDLALPQELCQTPERTVSLGDADGDDLVDLLIAAGDNRFGLVLQSRTTGFAAAAVLVCQLPEDTLWYAFAPLPAQRFGLVYCSRDALWRREVREQRWTEPERLAPVSGLPAGRIGGASRLAVGALPWCPPGQVPLVAGTSLLFLPEGANRAALPLLTEARAGVQVRAAPWGVSGGWGPYALCVEQRAVPPAAPASKAPVDPVFLATQLKRYKEPRGATFHSLHDLGGDPAPDLIIYSYRWGIDPKTMLIIFTCQADGTFRAEPDQVLRTRGVPVEWDHSKPAGFASPFYDVNGDGLGDLLLIEVDTHAVTAESMLTAFIDAAVHWQLTVRLARPDRSLPQRADVELGFSGLPPFFDDDGRLVRLEGDFNGDGRPDPLVRRGLKTLEVISSQDTPRLFAESPGPSFAVPYQGAKLVADLNSDRLADLVLTDRATGAVTVYLSQAAGRRPAP